MFNSFPQPKPDGVSSAWVHDWSAYQTVYDLTGTTVSVPVSTWQTFVDVVGKGFFKWCRVGDNVGNSPNSDIRVTIDGQPYVFIGAALGAAAQGNEISFEIPFKISLKIEAFNSNATSPATLTCDYLYLLQQSNPNPSNATLLKQSQRKMTYLTGASTTLTDVVNVIGSGYLLGVKFSGFYQTSGANFSGDIAVDSVQKMTDRTIFSATSTSNKQSEFVGPIRFNTALRIRTRLNAVGGSYVCMAWYSLD